MIHIDFKRIVAIVMCIRTCRSACARLFLAFGVQPPAAIGGTSPLRRRSLERRRPGLVAALALALPYRWRDVGRLGVKVGWLSRYVGWRLGVKVGISMYVSRLAVKVGGLEARC